jgi:hypothetical protein
MMKAIYELLIDTVFRIDLIEIYQFIGEEKA